MPNEANASVLDQTGSVIAGSTQNPNNLGGAGAGSQGNAGVDYKTLYEDLEKKLGTQGNELGEYRTFFEGMTPLLNKLDESPELVNAILSGKVDKNLAEAALNGNVTIATAEAITQAHTEVKKELGAGGYKQTSADEIAKMVEEKVGQVRKETAEKLRDMEDTRNFEVSVQDFISRTPDFTDYARDIDRWLSAHDDVTDIEVAYWAVKGQLSDREAKKLAVENAAENAKNMALNAGGGGQRSNFVPASDELVDQLIAGKSNPNVF